MYQISVRLCRLSCLALALSGCFAEAVFGQIQLNRFPSRVVGHPQVAAVTGNPNLVEGRELLAPSAIAVDTSAQPFALYVADTGNNRVLAWRNAGSFDNGAAADLVIGQRDMFDTTPKGPGTQLTTGLSQPSALAVDRNGNLYVADAGNNRILRFPRPVAQTDAQILPDLIIGQPNFQTNQPNSGNPAPNAQTLVLRGGAGVLRSGLAFDRDGNLWFSDAGNNRVLRYPASALAAGQNMPAANLVLGQFSFTTRSLPASPSSTRKDILAGPSCLAFDANGRLYVCDDFGRVLVYTTLSTGASAARALGVIVVPQGQTAPPEVNERSLSRRGVPPAGIFLIGNTPFVLDTGANRIVRFDEFQLWPAESDTVFSPPGRAFIGQYDNPSLFTENGGQPEPSTTTLSSPVAAVVAGNEVFVVDSGNHRVLVFPIEAGTTPGIRAASRVLGQGAFHEGSPNRIEGREFFLHTGFQSVGAGQASSGTGVVVDTRSDPPRLYVADTFNNRVLGFADARKVRPGDRADIVIGQRDFTRALLNDPTNDPNRLTETGLVLPAGLAVDAKGDLYVADSGNGRVLRFPKPFEQQGTRMPNLVLGQPGFQIKITDATPRTMFRPFGLAFTVDGHLLVSDAAHNRVLFFRKPDNGDFGNGQAAEKVFGQPDFISVAGSSLPNRMASPHHISTDTDDRLYVADTGNGRILIYDRVTTAPGDPSPALSLSGRFASPHGVFVSHNTGEIWVTSSTQSSVFRYPRFELLVLLDPNPDYEVAAVLPLAVTQDGNGNLVVADAIHRISLYYPGLTAVNGAHLLDRLAPCGHTRLRPVAGASFGSATVSYTDLPDSTSMPKTLGDVQVLVADIPAPIESVSPGEIRFVIPRDAPTGLAEIVALQTSTSQILATGTVFIDRLAPAFFTVDGSGNGQVVANNQDGVANSPTDMVARSGVLTIFGTGIGCAPGVPDGTPTPEQIPFDGETRAIIGTAFIPAENLLFSGWAPNKVSTWMLQVKVPDNVEPSPRVVVAATVNSVPSTMNARVRTTIAVKP